MLIKVVHRNFCGVIMIDDRFKDDIKTFEDINRFILDTEGSKKEVDCLLESDKDWTMMEQGDTIIATRNFLQPYMPEDPISETASAIAIEQGDELIFVKTQNGYVHAEWNCSTNGGCDCGANSRTVIMLPWYVSTPDIGLPPTNRTPDNEDNE